MIATLKNNLGYVYAYIEWDVVNEKSEITKDGEYVTIGDFWIHPDHRNNGTIDYFIKLIFAHESTQYTQYVFWRNNKHNRLTGLIPVSRMLRRMK